MIRGDGLRINPSLLRNDIEDDEILLIVSIGAAIRRIVEIGISMMVFDEDEINRFMIVSAGILDDIYDSGDKRLSELLELSYNIWVIPLIIRPFFCKTGFIKCVFKFLLRNWIFLIISVFIEL